MPTTSKGFRYPAGSDPLAQGDDAIHNLASDVDGFVGWIPVGGASGAVLAKTGAGDYAVAWTPPHYVPAGGAAGQVLAKASAADYDAGWSTPASGGAASSEIDYAEITSDVTTNVTTAGAAVLIVSGAAKTYDGSTVVIVEFVTPEAQLPQNSGVFHFSLWDGATDLGEIATIHIDASTSVAGSAGKPVVARRRLTPTGGSHTFAVKAWVGAGTGRVKAGAGGAGVLLPTYIRVLRA